MKLHSKPKEEITFFSGEPHGFHPPINLVVVTFKEHQTTWYIYVVKEKNNKSMWATKAKDLSHINDFISFDKSQNMWSARKTKRNKQRCHNHAKLLEPLQLQCNHMITSKRRQKENYSQS